MTSGFCDAIQNEELGLNDINTDDYGATYGEGEGPNEVRPAGPAYVPSAAPVVLSDRLTKVHVKGADHPTPFAMGTSDHDNTAGGMFLSGTTAVPEPASKATMEVEPEEETFMDAPSGWKADKINVDLHLTDALNTYDKSDSNNFYNIPIQPELVTASTSQPLNAKRVFNESDLGLEFIAREEWGGPRKGFAFRLGAQGLGYYRDNYVRPAQEIVGEGSA